MTELCGKSFKCFWCSETWTCEKRPGHKEKHHEVYERHESSKGKHRE